MTSALVAGLLAGWAIALPVGAIAAYLVGLAAETSLRIGACAALGVATADGGYALAAVVGGHSLTDVVAPAARPLRLVSAGILLIAAAHGLTRGVRHYRTGPVPTRHPGATLAPGRIYLRLTALTLLNPATVVYFAALVVGSRSVGTLSTTNGLLFAAAAFTASASWQLTLVGGGAVLGRLLTGPRGRLATAVLSSTIIAAFATQVAVSALR